MEIQPTIDELDRVLDLQRLDEPGEGGEEHSFRGWNQPKPGDRLFGGQVLSQCVVATSATVADDRPIHSFHGYFLRAGSVFSDLTFGVDVLRDGGSFSARRVQAYQDGQPIFTGMASFQRDEEGLDHQEPMPLDVPAPEELPSLADRLQIRPVEPAIQTEFSGERTSRERMWIRAVEPFGTDRVRSAAALAYAADYNLLEPTLRVHGIPWYTRELRMASLDHAMWWHGPVAVDDWLLFDLAGPRSNNGRGLGTASVYTRDGRLVAHATQQGMVRLKRH